MGAKLMIWVVAGFVAALQLTVEGWVEPIKGVTREGTDGRVEYIKAVITPEYVKGGTCHAGTGTNPKVRAYAKKMGCQQDYAGHLIAKCLGGVAETYNIIPQQPAANLQWYRQVEDEVLRLVREQRTVTYEVTPVYNGAIRTRPSSLKYKVTEGTTVLMSGTFDNPETNPCTHT